MLGGYALHPQAGEQEMSVFEYAMKEHNFAARGTSGIHALVRLKKSNFTADIASCLRKMKQVTI